MIFKQCEQVLSGEKTQTRRLVKDGDTPLHEAPGYAELPIEAIYSGGVGIFTGRLRWKVGKIYAVQPGRGKKAVGRIRIIKIRRERVQDISPDDAIAEGIERVVDQGSGPLHFTTAYKDYRPDPIKYGGLGAVASFGTLWDSIYTGTEFEFAANPEVWALTFEVVE